MLFMGKSTISVDSVVMFNSFLVPFVCLPEGRIEDVESNFR